MTPGMAISYDTFLNKLKSLGYDIVSMSDQEKVLEYIDNHPECLLLSPAMLSTDHANLIARMGAYQPRPKIVSITA